MNFIIGNDIEIINPTFDAVQWCRDNLIIENPDYIKKVRLNKWVGNVPREIALYERLSDRIKVPFGCCRELYERYGGYFEFKGDFRQIERFSYNSNIELYEYQNEALKLAKVSRNGVIVMPCGSGKTQTALQLVAELGGKCLWLTHTQDLLNQSMNRAKSCFGIDSKYFGTITGGKVNISQITFATVQTMCKLDLQKYKYEFDVVIVDECHKCVGSPTRVMQFYKVLTNLSARYKFGLTATPKRADGLEKSMLSLLGEIICEIPKSEVERFTCSIKVMFRDTNYTPDIDFVLNGDGTINYAKLVEDLTHNKTRFDVVNEGINSLSGPVLVLANRVEYIENLCEKYQGKAVCLSTLGNSKKAREERKLALERLNNGKLDCVFATYQLAKEGIDIPNLRYVVFATPEKDETTVTQSAGRVGRKADGKRYGTVIDYIDNFGMYKGWANRRKAIYRKLKYEIIEGDYKWKRDTLL